MPFFVIRLQMWPIKLGDLEDKLETYNKINGVIWRHFGKQMTKETKLRIHNITCRRYHT
jgi:hypothetical protein